MWAIFTTVTFFSALSTAWAAPTLVYPLGDQLPPVGRVGSEFTFELLPESFNSTSTITYTTTTLPSWLSWDSPTLTFYGTPSSSDEGQQNITVTATDSSGSTRSSFSLLVTSYTQPAVHRSFYTQINEPNLHDISSATILSEGTGVSIPPWWSFSLGFQTDTFRVADEGDNGKLYNEAHVRGGVGLPSWLEFDNTTFTFTGVAPSEGTFTVVTTGTDFWGYTGAQTSFVIEVGAGEGIELVRDYNFTNVETIAKGIVDYELDLSAVLIGNDTVSLDDVNVTKASDEYEWLSFDSTTNVLSGTVPDEYQNGTAASLSVPLTIASTNTSNTLTLAVWLSVDIAPYFFSTYNLPNGTIAPSEQYSFDLSPYLSNSSVTVNATVSPSDAGSWLTYYTENSTLVGTAPTSPKYNVVSVVFEATVGNLVATTTHELIISGVTDNSQTSGTANVPTSTAVSTASQSGLSEGGKIALAVVFGLLGLVLLILLILFLCCRRRRRKNKQDDENNEKRPRQSAPDLGDPFRRSLGFDPLRSRGDTIGYANTTATSDTLRSPASLSSNATAVDKLHRMEGVKSIVEWDENGEEHLVSHPDFSRDPDFSQDFVGYPDVIATNDPLDHQPRDNMSSFTRSMLSDSSRASWQSKSSFEWSSENGSGEGPRELTNGDLERASVGAVGGTRMSLAESIPRPRSDFTPRYPRHQSPTTLARLTADNDANSSHDSFSEFHSSYEGTRDSYRSRSGLESGSNHVDNSLMGSGSVFQSQSQMQSYGSRSGSLAFGRSGLSHIGESSGDGCGTSETDRSEEPAIVATAQRESYDGRQDSPRVLTNDRSARDAQTTSGVFDDADEASRRSTMIYPDPNNPGLGYNDVIYFGSPQPRISESDAGDAQDAIGFTSQRSSAVPSESTVRASTIRPISFHENPISPPLPQGSSFIRHRRTNTAGSWSQSSRVMSGANDGRVYAASNETFSMHPAINPPPTVSMSAATWSSSPPSTYRAEVEGGGGLPTWLHFDARELELWGVPPMRMMGETTMIRIMERIPRDARRVDPMSFGYEPPRDREVGRVVIEVTDRLRSPQFALDGSPHAL